jgi:hypothetical protein
MGNPFAEDTDSDGAAADELALSKMEEKIQQEEPEKGDVFDLDTDYSEDMTIEEPEDDDTREEKKLNRFREQVEGRARAEEQARIYKEELDRFRMGQYQPPAAPPPEKPDDPIKRAMDDNYDSRVRLFEAYQAKVQGGTLSADESQKYLNESRRLEEKQQELIAQKVLREQGVGQQDPNAALQQTIQARYFDIVSNPQVRQWTIGRYHQRIAEGASSDPNSVIPLLDDIADEARQRFRIGKYRNGPPPSEATKARHTGTPSPATPKTEPTGKKKIKMTPELRKMADAFAPHIKNDKERWQHWVNGPGKRLAEGDRREDR